MASVIIHQDLTKTRRKLSSQDGYSNCLERMKEVNSSWASVQNEGNECVYLIITEAVIITTCLCVSQSQQAA
jgi:hypothetical protein